MSLRYQRVAPGILDNYAGPYGHYLGDDTSTVPPATESYWRQKWDAIVGKFQAMLDAFNASKDQLATSTGIVADLQAAQLDPQTAAQVDALASQGDALKSDETSLSSVIAEALDKIKAVEVRLGWASADEDALGIFGVDDAVILAAVVTAGIAAVTYYVYRITTHTQDVNRYSAQLKAIASHVLTPQEAVALDNASANVADAGGGGTGLIGDVLKQVMPYVALGVGGWLLIQAFKKRAA